MPVSSASSAGLPAIRRPALPHAAGAHTANPAARTIVALKVRVAGSVRAWASGAVGASGGENSVDTMSSVGAAPDADDGPIREAAAQRHAFDGVAWGAVFYAAMQAMGETRRPGGRVDIRV